MMDKLVDKQNGVHLYNIIKSSIPEQWLYKIHRYQRIIIEKQTLVQIQTNLNKTKNKLNWAEENIIKKHTKIYYETQNLHQRIN